MEEPKYQRCRYCIHLQDADSPEGGYCDVRDYCIKESSCKMPNHCSAYEFTPIDAFCEQDYKGTGAKRSVQKKMIDNGMDSLFKS